MKKNNHDFHHVYDLVIVSSGGSAQSYIMEEINKQKPQNYVINQTDDKDNQKLNNFLGFNLELKISKDARHTYENIPENIKLFYKNIDENIKYQIKIKNLNS